MSSGNVLPSLLTSFAVIRTNCATVSVVGECHFRTAKFSMSSVKGRSGQKW